MLDGVTAISVQGGGAGIVADVVHDGPDLDNERCVEMYLEHPVDTFYLDPTGDPIIPLANLPHQASFTLRALDKTGSGCVPVSELQKAVDALQREKQQNRLLYRIVLFFFLFSAIVSVALGGITLFVFQSTKDLIVDHQYLRDRANGLVRTASADFKIVDNRLVPRDCEEDVCPAVQMSVRRTDKLLSSNIPNEELALLDALSVEGDGSTFLFAKVTAFARIKERESPDGTVVTLFTDLGEVSMAGSHLSLSEDAARAFSRAGLALDAEERNAQREVNLKGYFLAH